VQRNLILARKLEAKYSRAVLHRKNSHWVDKIRSELEFLNNLWGLGIGLSYRPARLHRLAEFFPWNRFLGSINV
jgi:hypothetical protein